MIYLVENLEILAQHGAIFARFTNYLELLYKQNKLLVLIFLLKIRLDMV
jgi:hypothetical protein